MNYSASQSDKHPPAEVSRHPDRPNLLSSSTVAISTGNHSYPTAPPYSPASWYPEYPIPAAPLSDGANPAYRGVRQALRLLDLDAEQMDSPRWNPLGAIIKPGDTVLLKPNFVRDFRESSPDHADCIFTHGAVIRAALDYAFIAMAGRGRLIIADAPQNDADFGAIRRLSGLDQIQAFYKRYADFDVEVYDLRPESARKIGGVIVGHDPLPGDPAGYVKVNLGEHSEFAQINDLCHLLYGAEYDKCELRRHHCGPNHEYLISKTVLDADVVISLPKLKTHKKVGLTVNLKNLVGINGNKNWLPHHREGTPSQGGDEFADDKLRRRIERNVSGIFKRLFPLLGGLRPLIGGPLARTGKRIFGDTNQDTIRSGNWYGNDTTWRMVLDLNRILTYAEVSGRLSTTPVRRFFSIVDGVVGGEGNGPLDPQPKPAGVILAGGNPVAVDLACARLMGYDYRKLPILSRGLFKHASALVDFDISDVRLRSNNPDYAGPVLECSGLSPAFRPHFGWIGNIELDPAADDQRVQELVES